MNVTHVSIRPTEDADEAGSPALTPELLAAVGARYSRSKQGLFKILEKIDPKNPDKSVDSIFKMLDYGHQSIADMAPACMFIDGISQILAYKVWEFCHLGCGQESSTRYIPMDETSLIDPDILGIPSMNHGFYNDFATTALKYYDDALEIWTEAVEDHPELLRIPPSLLKSTKEDDQKKVARMSRNFAFDRARYWIPVGIATNMMLVMPAREWVKLISYLKSHYSPEAQQLGELLTKNLELVTPRLTKHATEKDYVKQEIQTEFENWERDESGPLFGGREVSAFLELFIPGDVRPEDILQALQSHANRYAEPGKAICRIGVRFGWNRVALAEIRDLNRHRTGTKYCPLIPVGFYAAEDQYCPSIKRVNTLNQQKKWGEYRSKMALDFLHWGKNDYIYWTLFGTQYRFEHTTTVDKFLYEGELRTGVGAHFRYAKHLHDTLELWYQQFPETRNLILEGSAEPE